MLDDTGRLEPGEIDHGHKKDRITALIGNRETQIVAHGESNRLFAAGALRLDVERQGFISQFPLHEGSRHGVRSSGGPEPLTARKSQFVGGRFGCYRIGPDDILAPRSEQENQAPFQLI